MSFKRLLTLTSIGTYSRSLKTALYFTIMHRYIYIYICCIKKLVLAVSHCKAKSHFIGIIDSSLLRVCPNFPLGFFDPLYMFDAHVGDCQGLSLWSEKEREREREKEWPRQNDETCVHVCVWTIRWQMSKIWMFNRV